MSIFLRTKSPVNIPHPGKDDRNIILLYLFRDGYIPWREFFMVVHYEIRLYPETFQWMRVGPGLNKTVLIVGVDELPGGYGFSRQKGPGCFSVSPQIPLQKLLNQV